MRVVLDPVYLVTKSVIFNVFGVHIRVGWAAKAYLRAPLYWILPPQQDVYVAFKTVCYKAIYIFLKNLLIILKNR